ncbi:hypothetical protein LCGC14_2358620 [marine sediment metagenome]|uniref:2TM domain-containing protein n=1 Tax=marine sediment metagenome TaxID=412755 RepID=A0A0F9EJQ7_9ZZZZ
MKTKTYDELMEEAFKFLMFGCTIASFQFIATLAYYFFLPELRFITKWLFWFPAFAWGVTFIVFGIIMFKAEYGSHFHGGKN